MGTFHSICAKILRQDGKHIGIPINFTIYDEQDQLDVIKEVMKEADISTKDFKPHAIATQFQKQKRVD